MTKFDWVDKVGQNWLELGEDSDIFESPNGASRPTESQNPPSNKKNSKNHKIFENPLFPQK